jgi:hypothetical protein
MNIFKKTAAVLFSPKSTWEATNTHTDNDWPYIFALAAIGSVFELMAPNHVPSEFSRSAVEHISSINHASAFTYYIQSIALAFALVQIVKYKLGEHPQNVTFVAYSLTPYYISQASIYYTGFGSSGNSFSIYILALLAGTAYSAVEAYMGLKYSYRTKRPLLDALLLSVSAIVIDFVLFIALTSETRNIFSG